MATSPATVGDLEARWRPLAPEEQPKAAARLDDAWAILSSRIPRLADRIADGSIAEAVVVYVVCEMVLRALRNPEGYTQEATGPFSATRDSTVASGRVSVTDEELALIAGRTPAARTIRLTTPWPGWQT